MRPENFEELLVAARERPMLREALRQLGVDLKRVGHGKGGSTRFQTTTRGGRADDLSAVVFFERTDGSWIAIDNKQRAGKQNMDAISVLTNIFGVRFDDAVYMLTGGSPSLPPRTVAAPSVRAPEAAASQATKFVQPPKAGTSSHVAAYLKKSRLIPEAVVDDLLRIGAIYESSWKAMKESRGLNLEGKDMPMLVFPIQNDKKEIVGADSCCTFSNFKFKHVVGGSDPAFAWRFSNHVSQITKDTKLYFCEAPIDAISLCCLTNAPGVYISMGGNKDITFNHMREVLGGTPVICNDADEAGQNFRAKYPECETLTPQYGKDWNDELKFRVTHNMEYALKPPDVPVAAVKPVGV